MFSSCRRVIEPNRLDAFGRDDVVATRRVDVDIGMQRVGVVAHHQPLTTERQQLLMPEPVAREVEAAIGPARPDRVGGQQPQQPLLG